MRVFVTGIAGFLGSHIALQGLARGWEVSGIDSLLGGDRENVPEGAVWHQADCRDLSHYIWMLNDTDVVYHTAAAPYEGLSVFSPQLVFENTLMSTVAVLRAAISTKTKRVVFCSSMSRYGAQPAPFTEDMPTAPVDPYGIAKAASEAVVRNLCELHGLEWVITIPHNIYGPGQRYYDPFRNVAAIMINRILSGKPPVIYGDGSQRRCLSYIDDVSGPLLSLADNPDVPGEVINVGPDDPGTTILELAQLILKITESDMEPVFFPARPAEVHTATCSSDKARRMLRYQPQWELEDGLRKLAAWIRSQERRAFDYHLPIEIQSDNVPRTWADRLM